MLRVKSGLIKVLSMFIIFVLIFVSSTFAGGTLESESRYTNGKPISLTGKLAIKSKIAILKLDKPADFTGISVSGGKPTDFMGSKDIQVILKDYKKHNGKFVQIKGVLKGRPDMSSKYARPYILVASSVKALPNVSKVTLNKASAKLRGGSTLLLKATVSPKGASNIVRWSSDKPKVASVDAKGKVTAHNTGTATIKATSNNGKVAKCKVTVTVAVQSVKVSQTSITLKKAATMQLKATVVPDNASNKKVTWKSSNAKVATVGKNGLVTAVGEGNATITATTEDGKKKASCAVAVNATGENKAVYHAATSMDFAQAASDLSSGENFSSGIASGDEFYSKRLIIKGTSNAIDMSKYKPAKTITGPGNLYILQFNTISEAKACFDLLVMRSDIVYVEADNYMGVEAIPASEIVYSRSSSYKSWGVEHIEADAYAAHLRGSSGKITVAVVDTGIWNHVFLSGRIASGGYDFVDNDRNPIDENNHGTHVAGTIVDCTPNLNIMVLPVRVLNRTGSGTNLTVGNGIRYAADQGAKVINLSLGGSRSSYIDDAVAYAIGKGSVVVVSAGNDNEDTSRYSPANISSAIVVAAINSSNQKAQFSNHGASVDVAAPGVGVLSCVRGGGYQAFNGTSMSAPHVSAIAAMHKLKYPSYSPKQIETLIRTHTQNLGGLGWSRNYGTGVPKLSKAIPAVSPTLISMNKTAASLDIGKSVTLIATVKPDNASNKTVTWASSNTAVATVSSSGVVTAKAAGTVTVTARTHNNLEARCNVTVTNPIINPASISLNRVMLPLEAGQSSTLTATVLPANATNKTVTWSSSNTSVATVSSTGVVTAKAVGTATITAKTVNNIEARCSVTVSNAVISPTSVSLNRITQPLDVGQTNTLVATVYPANATAKTITWSTSNAAVATVSPSGIVTARSVGTATITAKTVNNLEARCTVTVSPSYGGWGAWSGWVLQSYQKYVASDTREVETATLYRYHYFVCPKDHRHTHWGISCPSCGSYIARESWQERWSTSSFASLTVSNQLVNGKYYTYAFDGRPWYFETKAGADSTGVMNYGTGNRYRDRSKTVSIG